MSLQIGGEILRKRAGRVGLPLPGELGDPDVDRQQRRPEAVNGFESLLQTLREPEGDVLQQRGLARARVPEDHNVGVTRDHLVQVLNDNRSGLSRANSYILSQLRRVSLCSLEVLPDRLPAPDLLYVVALPPAAPRRCLQRHVDVVDGKRRHLPLDLGNASRVDGAELLSHVVEVPRQNLGLIELRLRR